MSRRPKKKIFHIILTSNGKQLKTLYNVESEILVNEKFKQLVEESKNVEFPVRYLNCNAIIDANYELYIIRRNDNNKKKTKLKNEDGIIIDYQTNDDDWIVYDRENYYKEETFWVYGYHPTFQRKTFRWIYENLISNDCKKENLKQVLVYRNKLLISTTYKLNMVLCKNESDSVRLYNALDNECEKNKIKYVVFSGDAYKSSLRKNWFKKMKDLTNWTDKKLGRKSLRP